LGKQTNNSDQGAIIRWPVVPQSAWPIVPRMAKLNINEPHQARMYLRVKFLYLELSVQCDMENSADSNDVFTFSLNQMLRKLQQFYWRRIPENGSNLN